jgi:serine/threonine-protein kinase
MPLGPGSVFAGYTVIRLLGAGGMGEVYLVQHPRMPRLEALKILPACVSADPDFRARFTREADVAAGLWHPHIVGIHDRGEFEGQLWIAMDYVEGTDAARLLTDRYPAGMPQRDVGEIITAVAEALDYANEHNLLHRDVKPANILLTEPTSGARRILLADFGIARQTDEVSGLTATNMTVGSVLYAAPEQLTGDPLDGRADQYALAATAYHLISGQPPFAHSNPAVVIGRHLNTPAPKLSHNRNDLSDLDPVMAAALSKDPAGRFNSSQDFASALTQRLNAGDGAQSKTQAAIYIPAPVSLTSATPPQSLNRRRWTRRAAPWAVSAVVLVIVAGTVLVITHRDRAATDAAPVPAPPAAVLDGTYRLDYNFMNDTIMGSPNPPPDDQPKSQTVWRAFRSTCTSTRCTATATSLDDKNRRTAMAPYTTHESRLADARWQEVPERSRTTRQECSVVDDRRVDGDETVIASASLEPQPDGTLRGLTVSTVLTSECGQEGSVYRSSFIATRVDDVPPGVVVPDPSTVSDSSNAPSPAVVAGTSLDGTYRLDYDYLNTTLTNGERNLSSGNESYWFAFHSMCTLAGCAATGASLDAANHQEPDGGSAVLHLNDDHWRGSAFTGRVPCGPNRRAGAASDEQTVSLARDLAPQPDGTLKGSATQTIKSNECGFQGLVSTIPVVGTRTGPVPTNVVLADPALFVS